MAKNKKRKRRPPPSGGGGAVVAEDAPAGERLEGAPLGGDRPSPEDDGGDVRLPAARAQAGAITLYKAGQGYYTRMGTAIGAGLILVFGALYVHSRLAAYSPPVQLGVPAVFLVLTGAALFWVVGLNRKSNDFFIATEGEMKKVSWSTKKEVWGSTKVVLAFTIMMALFLFVVDILFMLIFSVLDVLQIDLGTLLGWDTP